jgi:nitrogen fixation NifU-like protein
LRHDHLHDKEELAQAAEKIRDPKIRAEAAASLGMTEEFLTHALTPANVGFLPDPDGTGHSKGSCGDLMDLYLRVKEGFISDVRFMPEGCVHTIACGSALTTLIKGRSIEEATQVDADTINEILGGLPRDHYHCAVLAATSLRAALKDYYEKARQPWKKLYGDR